MRKIIFILLFLPLLVFAQKSGLEIVALSSSGGDSSWVSATIDTLVSASITADSLFGDGSNLTGIASGGATYLFAEKIATETVNNSTTYQDDDNLFVTVVANKKYKWELVMKGDQDNATPGLKVQFTYPETTADLYFHLTNYTNAGIGALSNFNNSNQAVTSAVTEFAINSGSVTWKSTTSANLLWAEGIITIGVSGDTLRVQWAQSTAHSSNTDVDRGYLLLTEIQ